MKEEEFDPAPWTGLHLATAPRAFLTVPTQ
jgi:hypothetical protein